MQDDYILENTLRVARAEKQLTQDQLAQKAGVSRQTISAIENLNYNPSVKLAFILSKCLNKDINDLFSLFTSHEGDV